jgi:hypothetical protein
MLIFVFLALAVPADALGLQAQYSAPAPKVAVCIAGELRTFFKSEVQNALRDNVHRDGYEYFFSVDAHFDPKDTVIGDHIRGMHIKKSYDNPKNACPPGTSMRNHLFKMVRRYVDCYDDIVAEEQSRGIKYDYVMRFRPDHRYDKLLHPETIMSDCAPDVYMWDEHLAIANRSFMDTVLKLPAEAYSRCFDLDEWHVACGSYADSLKEITDPSQVPCCPMYAIRVLDARRPRLQSRRLCSPQKHCVQREDECQQYILANNNALVHR